MMVMQKMMAKEFYLWWMAVASKTVVVFGVLFPRILATNLTIYLTILMMLVLGYDLPYHFRKNKKLQSCNGRSTRYTM